MPDELADGSIPGGGEEVEVDARRAILWEFGEPPGPWTDDPSRVLSYASWSESAAEISNDGSPPEADVDGIAARVVATGDPPLGAQFVFWRDGGCEYEVVVDAGLTHEEMIDYVGRM